MHFDMDTRKKYDRSRKNAKKTKKKNVTKVTRKILDDSSSDEKKSSPHQKATKIATARKNGNLLR